MGSSANPNLLRDGVDDSYSRGVQFLNKLLEAEAEKKRQKEQEEKDAEAERIAQLRIACARLLAPYKMEPLIAFFTGEFADWQHVKKDRVRVPGYRYAFKFPDARNDVWAAEQTTTKQGTELVWLVDDGTGTMVVHNSLPEAIEDAKEYKETCTPDD